MTYRKSHEVQTDGRLTFSSVSLRGPWLRGGGGDHKRRSSSDIVLMNQSLWRGKKPMQPEPTELTRRRKERKEEEGAFRKEEEQARKRSRKEGRR